MKSRMWLLCLVCVSCMAWGCGVPGADEYGESRRGLAMEQGVSALQPKIASIAPKFQVAPTLGRALSMGQSCQKKACFPIGRCGSESCFQTSCQHPFLRSTLEVEDLDGGVVRQGDRLRVTVRIEHLGEHGGFGPRWSDALVMFKLPDSWSAAKVKHVGTYTTAPSQDEPQPFAIGGASVSNGVYQWSGNNLCLTKGFVLILQFELTAGAPSSSGAHQIPLQAFVYAHGKGIWTDNPKTFWGPDAVNIKLNP